MKKMLFSLLAVLLMSSLSGAGEKKLTISTDPWPPWIIGQEGQAPEGGIGFKVALELGKRLGVETDAMISPFARALNRVYKGKADMILMISKNAEREEKLIFTDMIIDQPYLFFYDSGKMGDFAWSSLEDIKDFKVGVVRSFNYGNEWNEAVSKYNIKTDIVTNDETNLKKLFAGRVDFAILQKANALYLIKNNDQYSGRLKFSPKAISMTSFGFALSKQSSFANKIAEFNKIISEMRMDGTIEQIINEEL